VAVKTIGTWLSTRKSRTAIDEYCSSACSWSSATTLPSCQLRLACSMIRLAIFKRRRRIVAIAKFMTKLLNHPQVKPLLSDEHFFRGRNADRGVGLAQEFPPQGRQRRRRRWCQLPRPAAQERHACEHQRAAGREAKLCYMGHATMETRQPAHDPAQLLGIVITSD
jgi:hypothetical protein